MSDTSNTSNTSVDPDGMPLAPPEVFTSPSGAYSLFGPAINQATSWHTPTVQEKQLTLQLLTNWKQSTENGISKETTGQILQAADSLGLQVCRAKQEREGVEDSFLLVYTKPGVHNYSGAFFMLRETRHSKAIIISPHDDSDDTYADTKIGMAETFALACISNGHRRGHVGLPDGGKVSDFVHSTDNLGTYAVQQMCLLFPKSVVLQIHGMVNNKECLYRCRNDSMMKVFKKAISDNTKLGPNDFGPLNAGFSIDSMVNTNYYIKTEIPVSIHLHNKKIIVDIVSDMEKKPWCGLVA